MRFVYSQTLIKLCNQLAGCQAPDSQQTPSSITIHSRRNPCSIWRLGFGIGQMCPLFGRITNWIEKIHQTRESKAAKSHNVYTMTVKALNYSLLLPLVVSSHLDSLICSGFKIFTYIPVLTW